MSVGSGQQGSEPSDSDESSDSVHVRRLGVADTLRWSWVTLRDRPEFVALALAAGLPAVAVAVGITWQSVSEPSAYASWIWASYLVQLLALTVAGGVVYLAAADAVAYRSRSLKPLVVASARRLPSLIATAVVVGLGVGLSLLPRAVLDGSTPTEAVVSSLVVLLAIYVFHRLLLAFPACVVDGLGPVASVRAGWAAGTGIVRKVFAVGVVYLVGVFASTVVSGLFGDGYDVTPTFVSVAIGAVLLPLFGFALAHLYLEGSRNR